jgi:hypothetical protein
MGYLENLYSKNMTGGNYIPFNSLDIFNETISSGTSGNSGGYTPAVKSPGNDLKIFLTNTSQYKGQMTFNVQNQNYNEGTSIAIDSNTINDSLLIKPIVNDGYTLKNYFQFVKGSNGKILFNTYNGRNELQGTKQLELPDTLDLGFDLDVTPKIVTKTTATKIQSVFLTTNYNNSTLNNELEVTIGSNDLSSPKKLKIGDSVDISNINNTSSDLNISVSGLSSFNLKNIRWQYANKFSSNSVFDINDFNILTGDTTAVIKNTIFNSNIVLLIEVVPNTANYPTLTLDKNTITTNIAESVFANKSDYSINVDCKITKADSVKIKTPYREFTQTVSNGIFLDLQNDFKNNEGQFKVLLTPYSNLYGDGITQSILITIGKVFDTPIIDKIDYPTNVTIPVYSFGDTNFTILFESTLANKVLIYHTKEDDVNLFGKFNANDKIILNYNSIKAFNTNATLDLLIVPYNGNIKGEIERISISFDDPGFYVSTQNLKDELFNAIASQLKLNLNKSSYLNHLTSFDVDDKQIIISNWDTDTNTFTKFKTDELGNQIPDGQISKTIVLKLYEPLPTNINKNDTLWISELMALPILQSVVISGNNEDNCIPLRAANFNIEVDFVKGQSTGFESYDSLILSGSTTSQQLIDKYLTENFIDVKGINIKYASGSTPTFENFVKYSSAVERLANFRYKKELAEWYDDKINTLSDVATSTTTALNLDIQNYITKKTNLVTGFDGWETYLTQSVFTGSFNNNIDVYNNYYTLASEYDRTNNNALKNNLPLHIIDDNNNLDYVLFLDMVGNYFDILWAYIKGISDQRKISEQKSDGISDDLLYQYLKSFGWDAKNLNSNKQLWDYTFGYNNEGVTGSFTSDVHLGENNTLITPEAANSQIWRRIANNLPYLLKHKGSIRGINALLTCYGIPASNISIMEFGGPNIQTVEDSPKFIYDSLTHNLVFDNVSASLNIPFNGTPKPQSIEFKFKPNDFESYTFITGSNFKIGIVANNSGDVIGKKYGYLKINNQLFDNISYPFYDGNYHSILINKSGSSITTYVKTNDKDRIIHSAEWNATIVESDYENTTTLSFTGFKGHLEEFRLWNTNLSESVFDNHVIMPEAINGNDIYGSTNDLLLRLDFERPQSLFTTSSINNVAPNLNYIDSVETIGFASASNYPWNYEVLERQVSLTIPNSGASRYYTNKVRLESQQLVGNLSPTKRATKKAFETSTKDSNRVGLFFSPNKDLDLDIAKSLGGESFDDFIGDPQYEYGYTTYPELDTIRNYYFERVGERNLYEFIRLIKFYDKSLFVNLKEMLPVRANATTGLLIAPHLLERNKVKINRPKVEAESLEGIVKETQITDLVGNYNVLDSELDLRDTLNNISAINEDLDAEINATDTYNFAAEDLTYEVTIDNDLGNVASAEWETYDGTIDYNRYAGTLTTEFELLGSGQVVGMGLYDDYGFNTYFTNGYGKYHYEENGSFKSKGVRGFLVTRKHTYLYPSASINGIVSTVATSSFSQDLIIQDFSSSLGLQGDPNIISIVTASGYLPSHHIYKGEKHTGMQNLFYNGSKQTKYTTIDGKDAVETFVTNPTTLRVTKQGRSNNEPILEVD